MKLVDSSAWIHLLRRGGQLELPKWLPFEEIVVCLPVIQEVLQGIRDDLVGSRIAAAFAELLCVEEPLSRTVVMEAVDLYRRARRAGLTPRSGVDCLVAACALRNDLEVVHRDRDFEAIARVSSLRQRTLDE